MKKKILIILLIVIVIALIGVGYFVFTDMGQEEKLKKIVFTMMWELNYMFKLEIK